MLAFRSLEPFRALREPDRRRRDEERLSRSEQRTLSKTQNNHLTGKAPYKFESTSLQRRVINEPGRRRSRSALWATRWSIRCSLGRSRPFSAEHRLAEARGDRLGGVADMDHERSPGGRPWRAVPGTPTAVPWTHYAVSPDNAGPSPAVREPVSRSD